jgi:hypothetical protein
MAKAPFVAPQRQAQINHDSHLSWAIAEEFAAATEPSASSASGAVLTFRICE